MSDVPRVTMVAPEPAERPMQPGLGAVPRGLAAIAGIVSAIVALAVGELFAGLIAGVPSPIAAVGSAIIDFAPPGSKDFMVSLFGTNDKTALTIFVAAVVVLVGALVGLLARRSYGLAIAVILGIVGVGPAASLRLAGSSMTLVLVSAAIQAGLAIFVLDALLTSARAAGRAERDRIAGPNAARRSFLVRAGALGALAVVGGYLGRSMLEGRAAQVSEAVTAIPKPIDPAPSPGLDTSFDIDGLTPLIVPNDDFYRIDTALITPAVGLDGWTLRVFGMVDKEISLTFAELMQFPLVDQYVTIACVSNEVGGNLVGNAKWTGVRLADVLEMAGVQAGATQIVPRSVDGWTAGFPTAWITDASHPREAMIAVEMNDTPLPAEHGFPARLIVPGLYGYVSATKWLAEIELTTLEAFDAYWVPRGWSKLGPILTQSRIDVPASGSTVAAGIVPVAGVAWAPDRGISKVEISVDGGDWQAATLATEIGPQTWVQWKVPWQATTGQHIIEVRATDGTGEVQTVDVSPPPPDGARGHMQIAVQVS